MSDEQAVDKGIVLAKIKDDALPEDSLAGCDEQQAIETNIVTVRGEEVRNSFGDLIRWLEPGVTMPPLVAPHR